MFFVLSPPCGQAQHGGDVVFCGVVKIDCHVAVQLLRSALIALFRQSHLLSNHRRAHDEQVTARSANRRTATAVAATAAAAAAACVATPTDRCLPFAAPLLHIVAASGEYRQMDKIIHQRQKNGKMGMLCLHNNNNTVSGKV